MSKCVNRSSIGYLAQASLKKYSQVENLESVNAPTLVVSGNKDAVVDRSESQIIARRIKNSIHIEFMKHGHGVNVTDSVDFNKLVTEFIEKKGCLSNAEINDLKLSDMRILKNYNEDPA